MMQWTLANFSNVSWPASGIPSCFGGEKMLKVREYIQKYQKYCHLKSLKLKDIFCHCSSEMSNKNRLQMFWECWTKGCVLPALLQHFGLRQFALFH